MTSESALLLTNDPTVRTALEPQLASLGIRLGVVESSLGALHSLSSTRASMVFADTRIPNHDCEVFLGARVLRSEGPPVILLADSEGFSEACTLARTTGVDDCLELPLHPDRVHLALARLLRVRQLNQCARRAFGTFHTAPAMIGENPATRGLRDWIRQIGPTTAPVLIEGEPGSGRRLAAKLLHRYGYAAGPSLVEADAVECAPERLEAMLASYADWELGRSAATHLAPNGTLVISEIGACTLGAQAVILRLLQAQASEENADADAAVPLRLIATTSRPLERLVAQHQFLPELCFRLGILVSRVAPLRERRDEIPALAVHFAEEVARQLGRTPPGFSENCLEALERHDWPGNVRELKAVVQGAVYRCRGTSVSAEHLSPRLRAAEITPLPAMPSSYDEAGQYLTLAEVEKRHILATLDHFQGSRNSTAASLDISIRTLRNKLTEYSGGGAKPTNLMGTAA